MNRRKFIANASIITGGAFLLPSLLGFDETQSRPEIKSVRFAPSHIRHGMYHPRIVHTNGLPKSVTMYEGQRFLKNGYGIGPDDLEMAMIRVGDYDLLISSSQSENVIDGGNDRFLIEKLRSESFKSSTSFQLQLVDFKANSLFIENGLLIQLRGKSEIESASMIKWDFCYLNQHNLTLCQDLGSELLLIEF